jgi:hypothetical protein
MADRSRWLSREETLSLFCSLLVTSLLTAYFLYLKQEEWTRKSISVIVDYEELVPLLMPHKDLSIGKRDRVRRGSKLLHAHDVRPTTAEGKTTGDLLNVARDGVFSDEADSANSLSQNSRPVLHPTASKLGPMFRNSGCSSVFDLIFSADPVTRQALLRQHLSYSSAIYDTSQVLHLTRLSNALYRFGERPVSLKESMQRDFRRYGYPYNPLRPQPPSAQVPLEGVVFRLLDFIF